MLELPVLPYFEHAGKRITAPYLNCFVGNGCVVAPLAGSEHDGPGLEALGAAFPGREVFGVPGRTLSRAGGGVHCVTQHVPLLP